MAEEREQQNGDGDDDKQMFAARALRGACHRSADTVAVSAGGGPRHVLTAAASVAEAVAGGGAAYACAVIVLTVAVAVTVIVTVGVGRARYVSVAVASIVCHK